MYELVFLVEFENWHRVDAWGFLLLTIIIVRSTAHITPCNVLNLTPLKQSRRSNCGCRQESEGVGLLMLTRYKSLHSHNSTAQRNFLFEFLSWQRFLRLITWYNTVGDKLKLSQGPIHGKTSRPHSRSAYMLFIGFRSNQVHNESHNVRMDFIKIYLSYKSFNIIRIHRYRHNEIAKSIFTRGVTSNLHPTVHVLSAQYRVRHSTPRRNRKTKIK